jgi:hypothetical protein
MCQNDWSAKKYGCSNFCKSQLIWLIWLCTSSQSGSHPIPSTCPSCPRAPHRSAAAQRPSAASSSVVSSQPQQLCGFRSSPQPVAKARPSTDNLRPGPTHGSMGMNHDESLLKRCSWGDKHVFFSVWKLVCCGFWERKKKGNKGNDKARNQKSNDLSDLSDLATT